MPAGPPTWRCPAGRLLVPRTRQPAYRARIRAHFAVLRDEREQLEAQLKALAKTTPAADTTLLDQLPLAGDALPG